MQLSTAGGTLVLAPLLAGVCFAQPDTLSRINPEDSNQAVRQSRLLDAHIQQGSWAEAADLLQKMIESYPHQVIPISNEKPARFIAIRSYCHARVAALPPDAIERYRERVDSQAKSLWGQFERTKDEAILLRLVDQYLCSSVGDRALETLGNRALAGGRIDEAIAWWSLLLPALRPKEEPADSMSLFYPDPKNDLPRLIAKWSIAQLLRGDDESATRGLIALRERYPDASGSLLGREGRYWQTLESTRADKNLLTPARPSADWPTFAGSYERTKVAPAPIRVGTVARRWSLDPPTAKEEPSIDDIDPRFPPFRQPRRPRLRDGLVCHPVTLGPYVFVSDGARLQKFHVDQDEPVFQFDFREVDRAGATHGQVNHTLSVSGNLLFARTGTTEVIPQQPFPGRILPTQSHLYCFDHVNGRLAWWKSASDLGLGDQTVFEGAPVVLGNMILIGATRVDAMTTTYIVCLDAQTDSGAVLWKRFLCEASNDQERAGSPDQNLLTLADRTVYCCTNTGAIAALDVPTAKLKWICEYPLEASAALRPNTPDVNPCAYDMGRLFVCPAGSSHVLCLDAQSGRTLWKTRLGASYLLGVAKGRLFVAGARVSALDVRTGSVQWTFPENNPGSVGRGLLAGENVYWPTASEIHVLDQSTGLRAQSPISLLEGLRLKPGNLIAGDGYALVAQNRQVAVLRPSRWLKEKSQEMVRQHPGSAEAHLQLAESAADDNDFDLALVHFVEAIRFSNPERMFGGQQLIERAREGLFETRLVAADAKRQQAANTPSDRTRLLAEAERLYRDAAREADSPTRRYEALRLCAEMKRASGKPADALALYHEILADRPAADSLADAGPGRKRRVQDLVEDAMGTLLEAHGHALYAPWEAELRTQLSADKAGDSIFDSVERVPFAGNSASRLLLAGEAFHQAGDSTWALRAYAFAARKDNGRLREEASRRIYQIAQGQRSPPSSPTLLAGLSASSENPRARVAWTARSIESRFPLLDATWNAEDDRFVEVDAKTVVFRSGTTGLAVWTSDLPFAPQWFSLCVSGLVCGASDRICCLDAHTGVVVYHVETDPGASGSGWIDAPTVSGETDERPNADASRLACPPYAVDEEAAYVLTASGRLVTVDLVLGTVREEIDPLAFFDRWDNERLMPHVQKLDSALLVWTNRRLLALPLRESRRPWSLPLRHDVCGWPAVACRSTNDPNSAGDSAVLALSRDEITCVELGTGQVKWRATFGWPSWDIPRLLATPPEHADSVYLVVDGYALCRLDAVTGRIVWTVAITRAPRGQLLRLYSFERDRVCLVLNDSIESRFLATGESLWRHAIGPSEVSIQADRLWGLSQNGNPPKLKAWNLHNGKILHEILLDAADGPFCLISRSGNPAILRRGQTVLPVEAPR